MENEITGFHAAQRFIEPQNHQRFVSTPYSGIGVNKLRELTNEKNCRFVLWVGNKRLIKRRLFDQYIEQEYSI